MSVSKRNWLTSKGIENTGWQYAFTDPQGKRRKRLFKTKKEADAFRVKTEGTMASGSFRANAATTTIRDVAVIYLAHAQHRCENRERFTRGHLATVTGHIWNYICPDPEHAKNRKSKTQVTPFENGLSAVKLAHLTAGMIDDFRDRLRTADVGVVTTRKILTTLSAVLSYAVSKDLVAFNTATGVRVIGRRDEGAKKIIPPAKDAMKAIINAADPDFRVQLIFAVASAARASEQHALRWQHIDFEAGEVAIITRVDAWHDEDITKSMAGVRTIPLAASVLLVLKEWRLRSHFAKDSDLVFPNHRGFYAGHGNMLKRKFRPLFIKLAKAYAADPASCLPAP